MPESLYRPPADLTTSAPQQPPGQEAPSAPAQSDAVVMLKRVLAGLVVFAGAGAAVFPPHTVAYQVCVAILGLGGLGITSQGVAARRQ